MKQAVSHAIAMGVKPSQIPLAMASYGYDLPQGSTNAHTVSYAQISKMNVKPIRDAASGEHHFTDTKNGTSHQVWFEGTRSRAEKVCLAKAQKLSGFAVWRLGYDNTKWWSALSKRVGNSVPKAGTVQGRPMAGARWARVRRLGDRHAPARDQAFPQRRATRRIRRVVLWLT